MDHDIRIANWNVHGLNARARHLGIKSLFDTTGTSIVCLQETKMELICSSVVLETLGSEFDDYIYLPAHGTCGGILLAWKTSVVTIADPEFTANTLSARVSANGKATAPWWLTVVYRS